jgi:nucleotide-binding universal stress UspA family protein
MIVVGVDGSLGADRAVSFAAREADLRGAPLRMVTAWQVPTVAYGGTIPMIKTNLSLLPNHSITVLVVRASAESIPKSPTATSGAGIERLRPSNTSPRARKIATATAPETAPTH